MMTPRRLYIIGNGFDLHHNIDSSFERFHQFLIRRGVVAKEDEMERFIEHNNLWGAFEEHLKYFNVSTYFGATMLSFLSSRAAEERSLEDFALNELADWMDGIRQTLPEWLLSLKNADEEKRVDLRIDSASNTHRAVKMPSTIA